MVAILCASDHGNGRRVLVGHYSPDDQERARLRRVGTQALARLGVDDPTATTTSRLNLTCWRCGNRLVLAGASVDRFETVVCQLEHADVTEVTLDGLRGTLFTT